MRYSSLELSATQKDFRRLHYRMLFTVENASYFGRRSVEAKRQRALNPPPTPAVTVLPPLQSEGYIADRLACVRRQLANLDRALQSLSERLCAGDDDVDAGQIDRLASAQARLAEQERQLAGRPLPGSLKPRNGPARRQAAEAGSDDAPDSPSTGVG